MAFTLATPHGTDQDGEKDEEKLIDGRDRLRRWRLVLIPAAARRGLLPLSLCLPVDGGVGSTESISAA